MNEQEIIQSFQNYFKGKGLDEKSLSLQILPELFIDYYQDVEFYEVNKQDDGDMLLFQYGAYDWGEGKYFQVNFTRQFYEVFEDESHQIYQLGITFFYEPKQFEDVVAFNQWSSLSQNLSEYRNIIITSLGYKRAIDEIFIKREITLNLI